MKKIINIVIILTFFFSFSLAINAQENDIEMDLYYVGLDYSNGQVSIDEVKMFYGLLDQELSSEVNSDIYTLRLLSEDGEVLEKTDVGFRLPENLPEKDIKGIKELFVLPYHIMAESVSLVDKDGNEVSNMNIAHNCGDGDCQKLENYIDCPEDCSADGADDYCNKELIESDPDCSVILEIMEKEKNEGTVNKKDNLVSEDPGVFKVISSNSAMILVLIIGFISVLLVVVGIRFIKSKK